MTIDGLGEVTIRRYLDATNVVGLVEGDFTAFLQAYLHHVERWELGVDPLSYTMMRELLVTGALHLCTRPLDEGFGLTLNIQKPPLNLFVTGKAKEEVLTGRVFSEGVKTSDQSRLFMESLRPGGRHFQSVIEVEGLDVLGIMETYYERSEQAPARFFNLGGERFLMVRGLPSVDADWVRNLTAEAASELFTDVLPVESRVFRFKCGCNPEKIVTALRGMFTEDPDSLFQGEDDVEALCPRCGARWRVSRDEFEAATGEDSEASE